MSGYNAQHDPSASQARTLVHGDVLVFPKSGERGFFHYLPLTPGPARSDRGDPGGQIIEAGDSAFLMLTVQWDLSARRLETLREELAGLQHDEDDPATDTDAPVRLAFAPVTDVCVRLEIGGACGAREVLSERATSGMPPYTALFNLSLADAARDAATAALDGREGHLQCRYTAVLHVPIVVRGVLEGELAGIEDQSSLDAALAAGRAQWRELGDGSAPFMAELARRALATLRLTPPRQGHTRIEIEAGFDSATEIALSGDVGAWFAAPLANPGSAQDEIAGGG